MCSNNITKQKLIFNDSSDYKFWANIIYTVILENVLSVDMKNSWNRPKSPRFTVDLLRHIWVSIHIDIENIQWITFSACTRCCEKVHTFFWQNLQSALKHRQI